MLLDHYYTTLNIANHHRDAALRGLCYYYFPPCGNATHFEPPNSLCASTCRHTAENLCQREWIAALHHFDNISSFLSLYQIDVLNCSQSDAPLKQFPHCCSNAGIAEYTSGELLNKYNAATMVVLPKTRIMS